MKKSNKKLVKIMFIVFVSVFVGMLGGAATIYTIDYNVNKKNDDINVSKIDEIDSVFNKIVNEYYGDVDQNKLVEAAVSGMLSVLDSNTSYIDKTNTTNFNNKMNGEYYGIGIEALSINETGTLVVSVVPNSPAERSGIKEGDVIIEANGNSLKNEPATYFTSLVSKTSTEIKLVITRNNKNINISVKPEKVIISSVDTNKFVVNNKNVGYIKISVFAANTASQFAKKLKELEESGIDSLVIDVRNNSGGYLSAASTILEMFMKKGTVLYKIESKNTTQTREDNTEEHRNYPVAILVNGSSASASEILAACFSENLQSEIVGNTTYGKGTVQETVNVLEGSMAKITTKKWLTPKGNWIHEVGLTPTIGVTVSNKYVENPTYANDNQLERAINALTTNK